MQRPDLIRVFIEPLEANKIPYFVTGSVAAIFYGEPRLTHDIDLVLVLVPQEIDRFVSLFPPNEFYCPPAEVIHIEWRRKPFGHFNLIHHSSGFKADIYTHSQDPLHEWSQKNRRRVRLTPDFSIFLAPPEYVIVRKLEYHREGGSDKHLEDIRKMLPQTETTLDKSFLKDEIRRRSLEKEAKKVPLF